MAYKIELDTLILGVLQDGPLHGYEIAKRIRVRSERLLRVGEGQLYPALHRMEEDGHVVAQWVPQDAKPPRKVYSLTESGAAQLATQKTAWRKLTESVGAILGPHSTVKEASHA